MERPLGRPNGQMRIQSDEQPRFYLRAKPNQEGRLVRFVG